MTVLEATKEWYRGTRKLPLELRVWNDLLVVFNFVVPVIFFYRIEAFSVLLGFAAAYILGIVIIRRKGYCRLLVLSQAPWIPLLIYLWGRVNAVPVTDFYGFWVRTLMLLNTIALIFGGIDLARYLLGEKEMEKE